MTKTLIVAADPSSAKAIERQHPSLGWTPDGGTREIYVTSPGQSVPNQRFDVVLVTDYYTRVRHYTEGDEGKRMDDWFNETVRVRLSGPDSMLLYL